VVRSSGSLEEALVEDVVQEASSSSVFGDGKHDFLLRGQPSRDVGEKGKKATQDFVFTTMCTSLYNGMLLDIINEESGVLAQRLVLYCFSVMANEF
jgi:hypothetical protein